MSKNTGSKILEIVIVAAVFVAIISFFRFLFKLDKAAQTKIFDSQAIDELKNEKSRERLGNYVEEYHKSGKWKEELLNETIR